MTPRKYHRVTWPEAITATTLLSVALYTSLTIANYYFFEKPWREVIEEQEERIEELRNYKSPLESRSE